MFKKCSVAAFALLSSMSGAAFAQTEIQWWHAMAGVNGERIVKLANDFNASQKDYKVVPTFKGGYADTMNAGIAAFRAGGAPHILQVFEVGTATMMAAKGAIKPVHEMMKDAGEPFDPKSYLPSVTGYYSNAKGEMLSFPFNSSTVVMWVNKDALKKAGVDAIPATWPAVFEAGKKLKAAGYDKCGFSSSWITWVNIENFSAWHNQPLATKANGLDGFDTELVFNKNATLVKHLGNLVELQKDKTFDYSGKTNEGEGRFSSGECPIMLSSSGFYGSAKANAKFDFTAAPMPYYPDVAGAPQNSIIGGASLWVMNGKPAAEYKGVAKFMSYLSSPEVQAWWSQETGYLPITQAAYDFSKKQGFFEKVPLAEVSIKEMINKAPTENSRGLRLGNLVQMRDVWADEIEQALTGKKSAQAALDAAAERGNQILRQFERTAK
ncbi:MAG: sn-glycerol-3-phosphate ABC transporter substrate-binding protein UgpB [Proteobacteria bacterium]|nr:sn-glycerol-3-phosphate ABC transporter substrate-binding protein UgpB [Pseudomonadota bacterium]